MTVRVPPACWRGPFCRQQEARFSPIQNGGRSSPFMELAGVWSARAASWLAAGVIVARQQDIGWLCQLRGLAWRVSLPMEPKEDG